jgi:homoserine O-acetyltransferase/O-succinyltransferase
MQNYLRAAIAGALVLSVAAASTTAFAADYPAPKDAVWIAHDFKFHTGEAMPELRLHYTTIGEPTGQPVLILHGSGGSSASMLTPNYAGELFGPGQPLDAGKYFLILPDAIGHGKSSKPSDGLRMKFPNYDYADMVDAEYRLVTEALGIRHLRLVTGNSMGGMETWLWGEKYPGFMDALAPMASQPTPMASRNWMLRRLMIETVRNDPEWHNGDYTVEPQSLRLATVFFGVATSGGTLAYQKLAPTRQLADRLVDERLAAPPPRPTPTTSSISGAPRPTMTHPAISIASRQRCWQSIRPTMSAILRKPGSRKRRLRTSRTDSSI